MKNLKILSVLSFCVIIGLPSGQNAQAQNVAGDNSGEPSIHIDAEKKMLSTSLAGEAEEGVFEIFVKKQVANDFDDPESLNNITPAAGVQFRVEF